MKRTGAFTLVELLVLLAVVGVFVAILAPAISANRDAKLKMQCTQVLGGLMKATAAYAAANKEATPNGMNSPWEKGTTLGATYFTQTVVEPRQICGIGQLMLGGFVPEKNEAIACQMTDFRENKGYNTNTWMPLCNYTSQEKGDMADAALGRGLDPESDYYYRKVPGLKQHVQLAGTYAIRGPTIKLSDIRKPDRNKQGSEIILKPAQTAFFVDHECADQKLRDRVKKDGVAPITGWGRVHPEGINTGYLDGSVAMFADEQRTKTWAGVEVYNYGNAIDVAIYDRE